MAAGIFKKPTFFGSSTIFKLFIHSMLYFVIIPAPSLTVSSTGPAATAQSSMMGVYLLTDETFNNFPVYKKAGGGAFLFVNDNGAWVINRYVYCTKMIFSTFVV